MTTWTPRWLARNSPGSSKKERRSARASWEMGVVEQEAFEEPLLGAVGGELDAVHDCLLRQARLLTPADAGQGDLLGSGLVAGHDLFDGGLELARLGCRYTRSVGLLPSS